MPVAVPKRDTVTILEHINLLPSDPKAIHSLPNPWILAPLDRYLARSSPVASLFIYRPTPSNPAPVTIDRLEASLRSLLNYYPHLTGRLYTNNGVPQINRFGTGALLITASCDSSLPSDPVSLLTLPKGLWPPFQGDSIEEEPFFRVQHTRFSDGGCALMVEACHDVCDGGGLFILVKDFSDIYNGKVITPPHIMPFPILTPEEQQQAREYIPRYFSLSSETHNDTPLDGIIPLSTSGLPISARYLTISAPAIDSIRDEAGRGVSTFTALAAFFQQTVYLARQAIPGITYSSSDYLHPKNFRQLGRSKYLPDHYFPNAIICPYTTFSIATLTGPLSGIASEIHKLTTEFTPEEFDNTLKWLASNDMTRVRTDFNPGNGAFRITPWNKFKMYDSAILDGIRPCFAGPPVTAKQLADGLVFILPPVGERDGDKSLMLLVTLPENVWEQVDQDERWNRLTEGEREFIRA